MPPSAACLRTSSGTGGAYAEYAVVAEGSLVHKPEGVTFEEAAAVPTSGCIALDNLRGPAAIEPGQEVPW